MSVRTKKQIRNHYEVERALADKLRKSNREERKALFRVMYDELFEKVPDHPRLTKRSDPEVTRKRNKNKIKMMRGLLNRQTVFAEFAPGDCEFCFYVANQVQRVYGMDISDQADPQRTRPQNFELIVYDGYELNMPPNTIDVLFSDQFIEHLHPEDVPEHYALAHHLLVPGGKYSFRYPHIYRGPKDISRFFTDTPTGFHLNESTFTATVEQLKKVDFSHYQCYWFLNGIRIPLPFWIFRTTERLFKNVTARLRRRIAPYLFPTVHIVATK
ncbi:methyltransferase domain-containing protein [Tunicatimonas pelagia]|uniref:methyltransferase domain-containing protein n=1 Tax=Tunicatimonas pelagia TaxID=931531 RepID=UPI00266515D0|nr:methyltransferase domain-containing protein [Tunicatimonas pelagia]WKN44357.1 methyltransferase domain-containing protein [Tunicatimonas pelagia]